MLKKEICRQPKITRYKSNSTLFLVALKKDYNLRPLKIRKEASELNKISPGVFEI